MANAATRRERTCLDVARAAWQREGWGDPRDPDQEELWTLFFTNGKPDRIYRTVNASWHRPLKWVESLVRELEVV